MAEAPVLSIIVTNYNYARFVEDAINSALNQSYENTEVIVVDDGSTDDSRTVILKFGDSIKSIFKENGGQPSAFNVGFNACSGDVVIFLDADDILLPGIGARVARAFLDDRRLAKIQYRMEVIDADGKRLGVPMPDRHIVLRSGCELDNALTFPVDIPRMATSGNAFPAWLLREITPIPERADGQGGDWYLTLLALLFGPVLSINETGALYRVHGSNLYHFSNVDPATVRLTISLMDFVHQNIRRTADRLGYRAFGSKSKDVLSVAFLGHRMTSLKLDPENHPIQGDTVWGLVWKGCIAVKYRRDVPFVKRVAFVLWFAGIAVSKGPLARWFAEQFLLPRARSLSHGKPSAI
jgi:glycosyltransferase involved in cell wall biosynthesis